MQTKRSHEGYLLIQHDSQSPGVSDEVMMRQGLPPGSGHGVFEVATITCHHCQAVKLVDSGKGKTPPYCRKCNHYICERCNLVAVVTGECKPFLKVIDEAQEIASRGLPMPTFERGKWNPQDAYLMPVNRGQTHFLTGT